MAKAPARGAAILHCDCGALITKKAKARHERTARHIAYLAELSGDEDASHTDDMPFAVPSGLPPAAGYDEDDEPAYSGPSINDRVDRPLRVVPPLGGGKASDKTKSAQLEECQDIAEFLQGETIKTLGPFAPVAAEFWAERQDQNAVNWTILCRNHPKLLDGTLKSADYIAYYGIGTFGFGLLIAAGVEMGWLAADGRLAQGAGVTDAWEKVMASRDEIMRDVANDYRLGEQPTSSGTAWFGALADNFGAAGG
jgi:hypothetical protein